MFIIQIFFSMLDIYLISIDFSFLFLLSISKYFYDSSFKSIIDINLSILERSKIISYNKYLSLKYFLKRMGMLITFSY